MNVSHRSRNTRPGPVLLLLSLALINAACASQPRLPDSRISSGAAEVQAWVTTSDHSWALRSVEVRAESADAPAEIEVDTDHRYQRMLGFGASITDSSAWLIQHKMSSAQRTALLQELFGRSADGIGLEFTRLTIGASDFSRYHYLSLIHI